MSSPGRSELRALFRLALPIVLTNLCTMLMGVVDTIMIGNLDNAQVLAAAALGNVWATGTLLFGMGVLFGLDPIITQAHGARDGVRAGRALQSGLGVALIVGALISVCWLYTREFLGLFGQSPQTAELAHTYVLAQAWSPPLFMVYTALRQYLQGRGILAPALWVAGLANVANALLNWVLIYGRLGLPAMGIEGAGLATGVTRLIMASGLVAVTLRWRLHANAWTPWSRRNLQPAQMLAILRFGLPIAIQVSLEMWAFGYATLMAGQLGNTSAAAHTIALNLASTSFMVPLGISAAAVTRVGNLLGAGRRDLAQTTAYVSFGMGGAVMGCAAVVFFLGRDQLPLVFTSQAEVVALCTTILPLTATLQIFDGLQVVGSGILRGMGKTQPAAWFNLFGYWVLALPCAHWMAFERGLGLTGIWWGLVIGLALVAISLVVYVHLRGPARVQVDVAPKT